METEKVFRLNRKSALLTYPNVTERLDFDQFPEVLEQIAKLRRLVVGREQHPSTGQDHYHVWVEWQTKINLQGLSGRSRLLVQGYGVNVAKHRKGAQAARTSWEYCCKDGDYREYGSFDFFVSSKNFIKEFADFNAWKYYRETKNLDHPFPFNEPSGALVQQPRDDEKRCCLWITGPPNSGKTYWLNQQFKGKKVYMRAESSHPYDNYQGELVIIYDDITPKVSELLHMSNCYNVRARVYGITRYTERYMPVDKRILLIVLNNRTIEECYGRNLDISPDEQKRIDALNERFKTIFL